MKRGIRHLVIFIAVLALSVFANVTTARADGPIEAAIVALQKEVSVGDVIQLTLRVTHPAGYRVVPIQLGQKWGEFEIRAVSGATLEQMTDGRESSSQTIDATLWAPGSYATPELVVTVIDGDGVRRDITVQPETVQVNTVLEEGDSELRDIKPQATLPLPPVWPWIAGGLIGLAIITFLVRAIVRRRRRVGPELPESLPDLRPAYLIALEELTRIEGLDLPSQGRFKMHYTLVSDVLRQYLEDAHQVPAMDRTTAEIRLALGEVGVARAEKREMLDLLREADLVKFAKVVPGLDTARCYPEQARRLVEATRLTGITDSDWATAGQMSEAMV